MQARDLGKEMVAILKEEMSREVYEIRLQALVNSTVVARETIKAGERPPTTATATA